MSRKFPNGCSPCIHMQISFAVGGIKETQRSETPAPAGVMFLDYSGDRAVTAIGPLRPLDIVDVCGAMRATWTPDARMTRSEISTRRCRR